MKTKLLIMVLAAMVLVLGGLFTGSQFGASTSWTNELTSKANADLGRAGYDKKEEILGKDITAEMAKVLDPKIAEEQAELERMLEEYYRMRLNGLAQGSEYDELVTRIEGLRISIYNRYTKEIDLMFQSK